MKKNLSIIMFLASLSISAASVAESTDVRLTGTISPSACTPKLSGSGVVDYGTIKPSTLKPDQFTILSDKQIDFSIVCDAQAKLAVKASSGRGVSAVNTDGTLSAVSVLTNPLGSVAFGLGLDNSKGVGGYVLTLDPSSSMVDGRAVDTVHRNESSQAWQKSSGLMMHVNQIREITWSSTGTLDPIAFTTMTGKLTVRAYINKLSEIDISQPVKLDGLTTLELVYL